MMASINRTSEGMQMMDGMLTDPLIGAVAARLGGHDFKCWFYGDSVGFEGLVAASDMLNDPHWFDFSHGFFRAWAARTLPFQPVDNTAPGHVMCSVVARTGDRVLLDAVTALARDLWGRRKIGPVSVTFEDCLRSLRQPYGGVPLSEAETEQMKDPGPGIWLDCMHFAPPFFAHLDRFDPGQGWAEAAIAEILGYKAFLLDGETGP
jgi:unsaturated rhamnogalacturonyl hydrolase